MKRNKAFNEDDFLLAKYEDVSLKQRPSISTLKETMFLLVHNKTVIVCFVILLLLILGAIFLPMICPFDYESQNVAFANKPPMSQEPINGWVHILGTDHLGRDVFVRLWYGARISLGIACIAAVIDTVIGIIYGCISGYMGGRVDNIMMRVLEIISGIPYLIVVLLLMAVLPQGVGTLIIAYTLVGWTGMARLIRGQVMSLNHKEYVIASKVMGSGMLHILRKHMIPHMMGIIIVNLTLDIPGIIFTEAFLSMLGMGVPAPYPSLGVMTNEGIRAFQSYPIRLLVPALTICLITISFNLLGDRFQDIMNPKLRRGIHNERHTQN